MVPAANAAAEHRLPDPEHIDLTEDGEDGTETGAAVTNLDCELIDLSSEAATAEDDDLGGDNCACGCHSRTSGGSASRARRSCSSFFAALRAWRACSSFSAAMRVRKQMS